MSIDGQWPFVCARRSAQLPVVDLAPTYADHCRALGERALRLEAYLQQARDLVTGLQRRWRQGLNDDALELERLADRLGLLIAQRNDFRAAHTSPWLPSLEDTARLASDHEPGIGQDGPDFLYGSFTEELDVSRTEHRYATLAAMGLMGFVDVNAVKRSPVHRYMRSCTSVERRAALRAIAWAPVSVWRVEHINHEELRLTDLLEIAPPYVTQGPVAYASVGGVLGPLRMGDALVARVVPMQEGTYTASLAVSAGPAPQQALVRMWLDSLWLMARLSDRRVTVEALLRDNWVPLVQRLFEWSFQRGAGVDEAQGLR